jgi:hypothetical protein
MDGVHLGFPPVGMDSLCFGDALSSKDYKNPSACGTLAVSLVGSMGVGVKTIY